jgi:hypothetical protein
MLVTLLQLSIHPEGKQDANQKLVQTNFDSLKDKPNHSKKEMDERKQTVTWNVDLLARALRETSPTINWQLVLETLPRL